jgi:hypothetical protein
LSPRGSAAFFFKLIGLAKKIGVQLREKVQSKGKDKSIHK